MLDAAASFARYDGDRHRAHLGAFLLASRAQAANEAAKRGTPYYMAPELFLPDGVRSFASDL